LEQQVNEPAFSVCPSCGNLIPADRSECAYCGYNRVEAAKAERESAREEEFFRALIERSSPFTLFFIGVNLAVFLLEWLAGGMSALSADHSVIVAFGAKSNPHISEQHQYYRFITAMFIHIGFVHFLLNNYALWIIGQEVERLYGSARFVALYLLTGISGVVASYFFTEAVSAGASGAIFGLFGVIATFAFRYRREIPEVLSRDIKRRILPIIAINLVFGFSVRIVDNAAHLAGLFAGVVLTLVIPYMRPHEKATATIWRGVQALLLALTFLAFVTAFRNYDGPPPSVSNIGQSPEQEVPAYFNNMDRARNLLRLSIREFNLVLRGSRNEADPAEALAAAEQAIAAVRKAPKMDEQAEVFRRRLTDLVTAEADLIRRFIDSESSPAGEIRAEQDALSKEARRFDEEYLSWLPSYLREHGYEIRTDEGRR
jgi:membrane associated rhomboid family serine protease